MITQNIVEINNPHWQDQAACNGIDPAIFFPTKGNKNNDARKICATCPVIQKCLMWIIEMESREEVVPVGFYAGLTPRERKNYRLCHRPKCKKWRAKGRRYCSSECKRLHDNHQKSVARRVTNPAYEYHKKGKISA